MENIFNSADNAKLVERFRKLTPETTPKWGTMNVAQMLLHCQKPMDVAEGRLKLKRNLLSFLFGKMVKNSMLKQREFKKNQPTVPAFKASTSPDFEQELSKLTQMFEKFGKQDPSVITDKKHPFFGEMTDEEWGILNYKHLDHHLRQFGV